MAVQKDDIPPPWAEGGEFEERWIVRRVEGATERADFGLAEVARGLAERLGPLSKARGSVLLLHAAPWSVTATACATTRSSRTCSARLKHGSGQPVEVTLGPPLDSAIITMRDHGNVPSTEDHECIYRRFERAWDTNMASALGLGLWIARRTIEAHRGEIAVESAPVTAATFTVRLPRSLP